MGRSRGSAMPDTIIKGHTSADIFDYVQYVDLNSVQGLEDLRAPKDPVYTWNVRILKELHRKSRGDYVLLGGHGPLAQVHYDIGKDEARHALVPKDYTFAMITNKIHFIKFPNVIQNYTTARATCTADGMGQLIMDDKGEAWHNWIWQYVYPKMGGTNGMWLGIDDLQQEGAWKWNDVSRISEQ
ncbi:unnamed protein product [Darwinula stevensoni]|uniref:Uncharacterized protein n=1 Tax=Darwinula stevensoni TaxID=69355 RepID=A0A7R9AFY4_9CRUS|nr:unnamed protein product [Darwinula stevensoni]CAG0903485.1 unnamed protein product [Darwinula stevensoni]